VGFGTAREGENELGLDMLVAALYDCDLPNTPGGGDRFGLVSKDELLSPGGVNGLESLMCFKVNIGFCFWSFSF
jgi:hypothetical protein